TDLAIFRARLRFSQADSAQLRINKNGIRNEAALGAGASLFNQICANDAEVVVRNVRERRPTLDVAQCVNSSHICFEFWIDLNKATFVRGDACRGNIKSVGVGYAASSD